MFTRAKPDPVQHARRFWKAVDVEPREGGFAVRLDGRGARTPGGNPLVLPTRALADLVGEEWAAQGEHVLPATMPATRLAATALDRTPAVREETADELARYAASDTLCYFAEAPEALAERERAAWEPVLQWAEGELGLAFTRCAGIVHQSQPPETPARVRALALELDDFALTAIAWGAALYGSAVLALAVQRGRLAGEAAFDLSRVDEAFQEEHWGVDEEAADRTAARRTDAITLGRWFAALSQAR